MAVTPEDTNAMKRLLEMMEGKSPSSPPVSYGSNQSGAPVELAGAGQVTSRDIGAMADVLKKLNNVTNSVLRESESDQQLGNAVNTQRNAKGVKVGNYQIMVKEDATRIAGKQYYSIYHTKTEDVIADDVSLYETALEVVKRLNSGKFVNDPSILKLFEADDHYTSHRTDAIRFKARMNNANKVGDVAKHDIYESRYQASIATAMNHKREIKNIITGNTR
jgi:hypothetical protein